MSGTRDTTVTIVDLTALLRSTPQGCLDLDAIDALECAVRELGRDDPHLVTGDEARELLGVASEEIVPALIAHGQVRGQVAADGTSEVRLVDVLHERWARESLLAAGGDELSWEELERVKAARPGTNPWERPESSPSA